MITHDYTDPLFYPSIYFTGIWLCSTHLHYIHRNEKEICGIKCNWKKITKHQPYVMHYSQHKKHDDGNEVIPALEYLKLVGVNCYFLFSYFLLWCKL